MILHKHTCLFCGNAFESKQKQAKYCPGTDHKTKHFRQLHPEYRKQKEYKRKHLNGSEQSSTPTHMIPVNAMQKISNQLEPASQMVFNLMKDQNAELRDQLKELKDDNKTLLKEKTDAAAAHAKEKAELQKQIDETTRALDEKPTGLGALVSDKDNQSRLIDGVLAIGQGLLDSFGPKQQQQLSGGEELPMVKWLKSQSPQVQKDFMAMASMLADPAAESQLAERLANINRSLMNAAQPAQQQLEVKKTFGR
jgi:hypothetical protein